MVGALTASDVRADLGRALEVDLIGPYKDDEQLDRAPSPFYLTGVPAGSRRRSQEDFTPELEALPHPAYEVQLSLEPGKLVRSHRITELRGVSIEITLGVSSSPKAGTRALSMSALYHQAPTETRRSRVLPH